MMKKCYKVSIYDYEENQNRFVFYLCLLTELGAASVNGPDSIDVAQRRELRSRPPTRAFGGRGGSAGDVGC